MTTSMAEILYSSRTARLNKTSFLTGAFGRSLYLTHKSGKKVGPTIRIKSGVSMIILRCKKILGITDYKLNEVLVPDTFTVVTFGV